MFYRFKKLFYVWMALVGVFLDSSIWAFSPRPSPPVCFPNEEPADALRYNQIDDAQQGSQSFAISGIEKDGNLKKYIILGRTRTDGSKIIQLIPLDGNMPDQTANWNGQTSPPPSLPNLDTVCADPKHGNYCDSPKIWGWTVDEANNLLYTLEQKPDNVQKTVYDLGCHFTLRYGRSWTTAEIHIYNISGGKFEEANFYAPDPTDPLASQKNLIATRENNVPPGKNITSYFKTLNFTMIPVTARNFYRAINPVADGAFTFNYPSIGIAVLDSHVFYVDGHKISSAENGLDASITITGDGYDNTTAPLYFKTLSRVATPNSGDVLIASGPTGNIAIVKFDSTTRQLTQLFSGSLNKLISDDRFSFPNNFKMAPIPSGSRTQYFLTFTAKNRAHRSEPTSAIPLEVFTLPIAIKSNNDIDWETSLGSSTGFSAPVYYPRKRSDITTPKNTIQTIVSVDNTQTPSCTDNPDIACSTQYFTTLYYNTDEPAVLGHSIASAKLFIKKGIPNSSVFGNDQKRILSDNILGVVFGTPPLYSQDTEVVSTNSVVIGWALEKADASSKGFSVDASLTPGFTFKGIFPYAPVNSETSFSVFGGYSKNLAITTTTQKSTSQTWSQSTTDTEPWANNKGWFLISRGFTLYDAYRLQGVPSNGLDSPSEPIVDYNNTPIAVLSILPSSNSEVKTEWVTFRLTDGCIFGSKEPRECITPHITPDEDVLWIGYADGMAFPTNSSFIPSVTSTTYWHIPSDNKTASKYLIDKEVIRNHVIDSPSSNFPVGQQSGKGQVQYLTTLEKATDTTGRIGGSFEEKISSTINDFGVSITGSVDFKISSEYNYSSKIATTQTHEWSASSDFVQAKNSIDPLQVTMHLLTLTDQTTEKPFWIPNWAWAKGNKPWLLTWTVERGSQITLSKPHNKNSKHSAKASTNIKNKKSLSSPKSSPAQTTSSIN